MFTSIPGSGKSYFARQAAERMGAVRLSSDAFRPAMYGSVEAWREAESSEGRPVMLKRLFGVMDYAADEVLSAGVDLIYDANTNRRQLRKAQEDTAHRLRATPVVVHLEVPYEVALKRGQSRQEQADQRQQDEAGMRELIERIRQNTDPFDPEEYVVHLDGQDSFEVQFAEFEAQVQGFLRSKRR